jgi:SAM-dependent methyltransferase
MSAAEKWDRLYSRSSTEAPVAARVLTDQTHLLDGCGSALDLACGLGGNSLFLARHGYAVQAWDVSRLALEQLTQWAGALGQPIQTRRIDLETEEFPEEFFDLVVVSRYLQRDLADSLVSHLKPGGLLFYQTFIREKSPGAGPANAQYLLEENELLRLFSALRLRYYREDGRVGNVAEGLRDEAYYVGQKWI